MEQVTPKGEPRNQPLEFALAKILADAIALAVQRPDVIAYVRSVLAPDDPEAVRQDIVDALGVHTKRDLAALLHLSTSTIDRLDRQGAPHFYAGDQKRYRIDEYRAWLAARGKRPTSAESRGAQ